MRPTLLRVLTDLYVQKLSHTPDEERHYTELALRLLDAVDVATRTAVASRLARHMSPPMRVIRQLAADFPEVAAAVRAHPVLQREAQRNERRDTSRHARGSPRRTGSRTRNERSRGRCGRRPRHGNPYRGIKAMVPADIASELNELFFTATADERRLILLNLEIAVPLSGRKHPARVRRRGRAAVWKLRPLPAIAKISPSTSPIRCKFRTCKRAALPATSRASRSWRRQGAQFATRRRLPDSVVRQYDRGPFGRARAHACRALR